MSKPFFAYLWFLLPRPYKRTPAVGQGIGLGDQTEIRRTVQIIASLFDDLKTAAFKARRSWVTKTAEGQALDLIGADRNLKRIPGEDDDAYQARLLAAFELFQQGGTVPGMVLAMDLLGYPDAAVEEPRGRYRYDRTILYDGRFTYGLHWALFNVVIDLPPEGVSAERLAVILRTINEWKPAHTMLAKLILVMNSLVDACEPTEDLDLLIDKTVGLADDFAWPAAMYNAVYRYDGSIQYNGSVDTLEVEVLPP